MTYGDGHYSKFSSIYERGEYKLKFSFFRSFVVYDKQVICAISFTSVYSEKWIAKNYIAVNFPRY